jgi:hypothetical protein
MKYAMMKTAHQINNLSPERGNRKFGVPKRLSYSIVPFWYML